MVGEQLLTLQISPKESDFSRNCTTKEPHHRLGHHTVEVVQLINKGWHCIISLLCHHPTPPTAANVTPRIYYSVMPPNATTYHFNDVLFSNKHGCNVRRSYSSMALFCAPQPLLMGLFLLIKQLSKSKPTFNRHLEPCIRNYRRQRSTFTWHHSGDVTRQQPSGNCIGWKTKFVWMWWVFCFHILLFFLNTRIDLKFKRSLFAAKLSF